MNIFALMVSVFFATLIENGLENIFKAAVKIFLLMMVISLAVAWLMYPFP